MDTLFSGVIRTNTLINNSPTLSTMEAPWVKKYQPNSTKELVDQDSAVKQALDFVRNFKKQRKKAILLYGAPGCGKTSLVHAIANEFNLELIEVNASDTRNKDAIHEIIGNASKQMSLFMQEKLILLDEVDGVSGNSDRGGIPAIASIIESTRFPIIMTANDPFHKKFSSLRKKVTMVQLEPMIYTASLKVLESICKKEGVEYEENVLKALARRSGGDLRAAINDLQTLVTKDKKILKADLDELSQREQIESINNALLKVFKTTDPNLAIHAFDNVNEDLDKCFMWLDENIPKEYKKPEDLERAYNFMSLADVYSRRIRRWQHWRFMVYINAFLSAGIAVSKDEKYKKMVSYQQSQRPLKIWLANQKYNKRKAIAEKIASHTHSSTKLTIKNTLPYIKHIFKHDKAAAESMAEQFELDKDEISWLTR